MANRTIFRFQVSPAPTVIEMGASHRIIHFGQKPFDLHPSVWIEIDPSEEKRAYVFEMCGTGQPVPEGNHAGSIIEGHFVWHWFYRLKEAEPCQ